MRDTVAKVCTILTLNTRWAAGLDQAGPCNMSASVRGMVPRPTVIEVEHQDIEGNTLITEFTAGVARLVGHEVDHLFGTLYRARMRPGVQPIPVSQYTGTGQRWGFPSRG